MSKEFYKILKKQAKTWNIELKHIDGSKKTIRELREEIDNRIGNKILAGNKKEI